MLTAKQEKFVRELLKGKSQRAAYRSAYPSSRKWKETAIDSQASRLFKNSEVNARYEELKKKAEDRVTYDVAAIRKLIIDTELAILQADVLDDEVDGKAVKNKRWDSRGRVVCEHYDKQEAVKVLREMLGIDSNGEENGIHIHLHGAEEYDG